MAAAAGCTLHQIASALYRSDPEKPSVIEGGGGTRTVILENQETIVDIVVKLYHVIPWKNTLKTTVTMAVATFRSHFAALAPRCDPQLLGISTSRRQWLEID